jgi:hypothetical protein
MPKVVRLPHLDLWRFRVSSLTRPGVWYEVVIEPQQPDDPFLCSCPRFTLNTHHHGEACHHVAAAVRWVQQNARPLAEGRAP